MLYISHGTRLDKGKQEAVSFIQSIQGDVHAPLQQICFLELCSPTIEQGVMQLVKQGATTISVVPVLLLSATHDQSDIPDELRRVQQLYPSISFNYGKPLGVQDRLINILVERINDVADSHSTEPVLLVGRGSHVKSIQVDISTIATKLQQKIKQPVTFSYLAACEPSFDEALEYMSKQKQKHGLIVPYLWFNGLLIQSMKRKIEQYNQTHHANLKLSHHLHDHPAIKQALIDRANETIDASSILREVVINDE